MTKLLAALKVESLNALLDGNQAKLTRIANQMQKTVQIQLGKLCPECNGKTRF